MFTGIIEEIGKVKSVSANKINIEASYILNDVKVGDSISVNGVCLTVSKYTDKEFTADISQETYKTTSLGTLKSGVFVNLERALPANGRFGGHIVSGHVDGTGTVYSIRLNESFADLKIKLSPDNIKHVVKKGSIAVNGISLTIADVNSSIVNIAVIPHTYENTILKYLKDGDIVNIETDILAKYVEKFLSTGDNRTGIDMEFLQRNGF